MNVLTKSSEVKICKFDNSYPCLGISIRDNPTPVKKPELLRLNLELASQLGIEIEHTKDDLTGIFVATSFLRVLIQLLWHMRVINLVILLHN